MDDDLSISSRAGVEVSVELQDGTRRWCFFMTPQALGQCGDWISGTHIRIHFGAPHMIVVEHISEEIIEQALHHIDGEGELELCTRAFD